MTPAARIPVAFAAALAAGVAMSFGQTYLPSGLHSLANSATPVVALAALVSLAARGPWSSVTLGALAGPIAMVGYYATAAARGFAGSWSYIALWCTAGVVFGSIMGAAVWTMRGEGPRPLWRGAAAGWLPGIAIGEGLHGLLRISESTSTTYWWTQIALAAVLLAALCATRVPRSGAIGGIVTTLLTAAALFGIYGAM